MDISFHTVTLRRTIHRCVLLFCPGPSVADVNVPGGFIVSANVTWRWVYGLGCIYQGLVALAVLLFGEET